MKEIHIRQLLDLVNAGVVSHDAVRARIGGGKYKFSHDIAMRLIRMGIVSPATVRESNGFTDLSDVTIIASAGEMTPVEKLTLAAGDIAFWQPIDTADKGGRALLLRDRTGSVWVGRYYKRESRNFDEVTSISEGWTNSERWMVGGSPPRPTHWAEIPPLGE